MLHVPSTPVHAVHSTHRVPHTCCSLSHTHTITSTAAGIELEATTATRDNARSNSHVGKFVEFYIGEQWTAKQLFFTGTAQGETMVKRFPSAAGASKIRLSIDNDDAWGFWRIKFGGVIIHEYKGGAAKNPPENEVGLNGIRFWIDGNVACTLSDSCPDDSRPVAPASIELDIPSTSWLNLVHALFSLSRAHLFLSCARALSLARALSRSCPKKRTRRFTTDRLPLSPTSRMYTHPHPRTSPPLPQHPTRHTNG